MVDGDWKTLENSLDNLSVFFYESLWPPNWKVLEARSYPVCDRNWDILCSPAYIGIVETLKIAFVSTGLGFILSLPLATLASRNLHRDSVAIPFRFLLSAMRTLPSLIWAIFFVILIGLGPISGVMAMTFYTIGYLGKLQYETIEGLSKDPLDAAKAMGLSNIEIIMRVVIPESANNLISQLLFMFKFLFIGNSAFSIFLFIFDASALSGPSGETVYLTTTESPYTFTTSFLIISL